MLSKALSYLCMEVVQLRRPFCPLSHARQQQEVGMLPPHHLGAGSWLSRHSIRAGLQAQVRQKSAPTFLQRDSQPRNETRTDSTTYHSSVQIFQRPWGAQKDPLSQSPMHPPVAQPWQPLLPPQHGDYQMDQSKRKQQCHLHQKHCATFSP